MREFNSLTTRGRAQRLRAIAVEALASFDIDVHRIQLVNNEANCTFRIDSTDRRSYALRVNLPAMRTAVEIESELTWEEAICRDTTIPAPMPVRARDGGLAVAAHSRGVPEPRLCNILTWVRGKPLSRSRSQENFERLGTLAAQLHKHGKEFDPSSEFSVPRLDTIIAGDRPDRLFGGDVTIELPARVRFLIDEIRNALDIELDRIFSQSRHPQLIHGDLHWWNVLVDGSILHPIDFEDCGWGFPIQDIAITFYYVLWDERFPSFLEAFKRGYKLHSIWPEEYDGQLELLMGQRALDLLNLLLGSAYQEEQELAPEYVDIIDRVYRLHFERWQSLRSRAG